MIALLLLLLLQLSLMLTDSFSVYKALFSRSSLVIAKQHIRTSLSSEKPDTAAGYFKLSEAGKTTKDFTPSEEQELPSSSSNLKDRVLRQLVNAFDNLPEWEVEIMYRKLTAPSSSSQSSIDRSYIVGRLVDLTKIAEDIEDEAERRGGSNIEDLSDNIRTIRSQLRMYGKDADFYDDQGERVEYNSALSRAFRDMKWPWAK